jgi:hypothetical protein
MQHQQMQNQQNMMAMMMSMMGRNASGSVCLDEGIVNMFAGRSAEQRKNGQRSNSNT